MPALMSTDEFAAPQPIEVEEPHAKAVCTSLNIRRDRSEGYARPRIRSDEAAKTPVEFAG